MIGNNYETIKLLLNDLILLKEENEKSWRCNINYEIVSQIFDKYRFSKISIPFSLNNNDFISIISNLKKLKNEYFEIEELQKNSNQLTNSEMDKMIYTNYDKSISFAPYLYGKITCSDVEYRRELIQESIEFYKNKNL
jgi:hypothetical protein